MPSRRGSISRARSPSPTRRPTTHQELGPDGLPLPTFEVRETTRSTLVDERNGDETQDIGMNQVYDRITAATNRLTDIRIEQFDGSPETDVVNWLERYEDMALARRWDELARKEQLPSFLTGAARYWLSARRVRKFGDDAQPPSVRGYLWGELRWIEAKQVMLAHFLSRNYRDHLRECLNAKQKREEDVLSFFNKKIYYGSKLDRSDAEIVSTIKETLRPELQFLISNCEVNSLDGLLTRLKECELTAKRNPALTRNLTREFGRESRSEYREARDGRHSRSRNQSPYRSPARGMTSYDRQASRRSPYQSPQRNVNNVNKPTDSRRCYNCNDYGHIASECRRPQYMSDQRRNFASPVVSREPSPAARKLQDRPPTPYTSRPVSPNPRVGIISAVVPEYKIELDVNGRKVLAMLVL